MSNINISKQDIYFTQYASENNKVQKISTPNFITFPSNVINCSMTVVGNSIMQQLNNVELGTLTSIGAGIDNISYSGTQVFFTAWIQLTGLDFSTSKPSMQAALDINNCYLTVQAIAECE